MNWTNFHTHCCYCDGSGTPQEYIDEAFRRRMPVLGFSSHAPLPFDTTWTMHRTKLEEYCNIVKLLKKENADKLRIKFGLEIDFIPGVTGPCLPGFKHLNLDYSIGSVHFLSYTNSDIPFLIDGSEEELQTGLEDNFNGNIKKAVEHYYLSIQEMVSIGGFDIIGHFDIIKKNNACNKFFSEDEPWYRNIVLDALSFISKSSLILEVNTGGIARKYINTPYPSAWILEECFKLKIPITLNSDAHHPKNITASFAETAKMLNCIGYKELFILGENGWEPRKFTAEGLSCSKAQ